MCGRNINLTATNSELTLTYHHVWPHPKLSFMGCEVKSFGGHIGKLQNMGKAKTSAQEHVGYFHY